MALADTKFLIADYQSRRASVKYTIKELSQKLLKI
jgi:hypothetical protein